MDPELMHRLHSYVGRLRRAHSEFRVQRASQVEGSLGLAKQAT